MGTQRTGSSAIAKLINLHPNILSGLEWTSSVSRAKKIPLAQELLSCNFSSLEKFHREYVSRKHLSKLSWVGFKILFSSSNKWAFHPMFSVALWFDRLNDHLRWIRKEKDIHIIHIVRNDNLEWLKSVFLAKATKVFSGKNYPEGYTVQIDIHNAIARVRSKMWVDECIGSLKSSNPYFRIEYEKFKENNQKTAVKMMNFFNMPGLLEFENYNAVRQSKHDACDYIRNYQKLRSALKQRNLL
jgi:hypothetical protein